ncbi:MAG: hypothetical protein AAF243_13940 [Cyanobacteria bacterium P01_A01_bin.137]
MYNFSSQNRSLDTRVARRAQRLTQRVTWLSNWLGMSESPIVDAVYLRHLPEGTFGRAWIDALDMAELAPMSDGSRRQQLHDGVHTLTGYGTDLLGEAQVQAFLMGAKFRLFHGVLLSQMLFAVALSQPVARRGRQSDGLNAKLMLHHLNQAYRRGRRSQFDPDRWQPEKLWHLPLVDVKAIFKV